MIVVDFLSLEGVAVFAACFTLHFGQVGVSGSWDRFARDSATAFAGPATAHLRRPANLAAALANRLAATNNHWITERADTLRR